MRRRLSDVDPKEIAGIHSRSHLKKAIKRGEVLVNGNPGRTGDWVSPQDVVVFQAKTSDRPTLELPIEVCYEDEHLAVVHKPAGLPVSGNRKRQLDNCLSYNLTLSPEPDALRHPQPVHRLDKATAGLLLCAKTRSSLLVLNQLIAQQAIDKQYQAICIGRLHGQGAFVGAIDGKRALSEYKVLDCVASRRYGHLSHLLLTLHTGRTHQLRKHCARAGLPIMGDRLYCPADLLRSRGLRLQATALAFEHPMTGPPVAVRIPFKYGLEK